MIPERRSASLAAARLYLCTPLRDDLDDFLDAVLAGGVDLVQLRDKTTSREAQVEAAPVFRRACDRHEALFIINDDPSLAVEVGADGVHVGQDDMHPDRVRQMVGEDLLIGRSTHSVEEVDRALQEPCDYFAVGPVTATPTKLGRPAIGLDPVRHAAAVGDRPWFVTGGMAADTVGSVTAVGATRVVVVRALTQAAAPRVTAREIAAALNPG